MKRTTFYFLLSLLLLPFCGYTQNTVDTNMVFTIVQRMPKFDSDIPTYVNTHFDYSPKAGEPSQGVVYVTFIVERNGKLTGIHVLKPSGSPTADAAAVKCISSMPNWKPGEQNGQVVRTQFNIPIRFDAPVIEQNSVNPTTPPKVK